MYPVEYTVFVDATAEDTDHAVSGTITITNPAPMDATVTVTDLMTGDIDGNASCPSNIVPAVGNLVCTYSADLADKTTLTNTATAKLENGTEYTGTASVDFSGATMTEIDEEITVTDTLFGGELGTVSAANVPHTFDVYVRDVTAPEGVESCGLNYQVDNTATLTTNDTQSTTDDDWSVDVTIACVCSLTQGFWKTHNESFHGGAPAYDGWYNLAESKELTEFYLSGMTWYEVFWTAPKGNAYYQLAHQYQAAKLNYLNGAWAPGIVESLLAAEVILNTYAPEQLEPPKGKAKKEWKKTMEAIVNEAKELAGIFGAFNEGDTNPAGHCSEPPIVNTLQ